jgi:hypothetical protein
MIALIEVTGRFDMDQVAAQFPGLLTFRGDPAAADGTTWVEGHVDLDALKQAIEGAAIEVVSTATDPPAASPSRFRRLLPYAGPVAIAIELVRFFL